MRAFMAVILSVSLLVSSVSPALAQLVPVGPGGKALVTQGESLIAGGKAVRGTQLSEVVVRELMASRLALLTTLPKGSSEAAALLRSEFAAISFTQPVTPVQREQAVDFYHAD